MNQRKGGEWPSKSFHDQSPRKYETGQGSKWRPLDDAVRHASVARHITDCATQSGEFFFMLLVSSADFFLNLNFEKKILQKHHRVKPFGSRSGPTLCRSWSGSKLFAKAISIQQKLATGLERVKDLTYSLYFSLDSTVNFIYIIGKIGYHSNVVTISRDESTTCGLCRTETCMHIFRWWVDTFAWYIIFPIQGGVSSHLPLCSEACFIDVRKVYVSWC